MVRTLDGAAMSDVPRRAVDATDPAAPADVLNQAPPAAATPSDAGPVTASAGEVTTTTLQEEPGDQNVNSRNLTEDQLDWRENQSRQANEVRRSDFLLLGGYALAAVVALALLLLLYRYLF